MNRQQTIIAVLSLVLPYVVFRLAFLWIFPGQSMFEWGETPVKSAEDSQLLTEMHELYDQTQPEVFIVGSSMSHKAVDEVALAKQLGLREDAVQKLWSGMATMPTISLMIQKRILERGLKPKVIVIASPPMWLLTNKIITEKWFDVHWTGDLDPKLESVIGLQDNMAKGFAQKKAVVQDQYMMMVRTIFAEQMFDKSAAEVEETLDAMFDFEGQRKDVAPQAQLIALNIKNEEEDTLEWAEIPPSEELLLPHLITQIQEAGINVVIVELPVAKAVKGVHTVPMDTMLPIIEEMGELGAGHLYYFDWEAKQVFSDNIHMNGRGRELFTQQLAKDLQKIHALDANIQPAEVPEKIRVPTISWSKNSKYDKELLPSERLSLQFEYPWRKTALELCVSGSQLPNGNFVELQGEQIRFVAKAKTGLHCYQTVFDKIDAQSTLTILNPLKTSLYIHRLELNGLSLLPKSPVMGHELEMTLLSEKATPNYPVQEMRKVTPWLENKLKDFSDLQAGEVLEMAAFSDLLLVQKRVDLQCRPFDGLVQGKSTADNIALCKDIFESKDPNEREGKVCSSDDSWFVFSKEKVNWADWQIALKEDRVCWHGHNNKRFGWWSYPNDRSRVDFGFPKTDYAYLTIDGISLQEGDIHVLLRNEEKVFLDRSITELNFEKELLLDQPVLRSDRQITVEIATDNFVFLRGFKIHN